MTLIPMSWVPLGMEYAVRACNCLPDRQALWTAQDVEQSMLQGSEYYLLFRGEDVAGGAAIRIYGDSTADLFNFALFPQYRGQGLGRKSLGLILELLRGKQVSVVYLNVRRDNAPAFKLYTGCGFVQVQQDSDSVLMSLDLRIRTEEHILSS